MICGTVLETLLVGALLLSSGVSAQSSSSTTATPASSPPPAANSSVSASGTASGSGNGTDGVGAGGGSDGSGGSGPPAASQLPDSSVKYEPNINMTYWLPIRQPPMSRYPDELFYGNTTRLKEYQEWNYTYSSPPSNLTGGGQTALGTLTASFHANPDRRAWAPEGSMLGMMPEELFAVTNEFSFAGTRAIIRGNITDATWGNATQPTIVVIWWNNTNTIIPPGAVMPIPARVDNVTKPFGNGIIYDTGEQEFGAHDLQVRVYSGTLKVEGLEVHTGMLSEYKSLDAVPRTTVNTIVDGDTNSYFQIQGTKAIRSEILGDGGSNGSTVQWDSVDYTGLMTFQTVPNSTYMIINGTMGPEYSRYSIHMSPLPPGAIPLKGGTYSNFQFSPYRNPGAFYLTPLDPQIQYAVSIQGAINEATETTAFTPAPANIHSVTFYAGTKPLDPPPSNTTSTESEAPHGEARASRNAKIIGGAVGGGVGGLLLLGLLAFCCLRGKKKPSPVVSDPTPFEIDGSGGAATRTSSEGDDEEGDKVADELTPAQVAKAREAGFLAAGGAGNGQRRWTWRQPPSGPVSAFGSAQHPPVSEAGVSAVPSSVLDPGGPVPFSHGPASAVPSSVMIPHTDGPGSIAASSSLEPSDAVDSRPYGVSAGEGSSTGAGSSSAILSPTSTQVNSAALKPADDSPAILATPLHGDRRVRQAEDGGAIDEDENVDMIPPSYNPSWANRGAPLEDSGAVTRVAGNSRAPPAVDNGAVVAEGRLSTDIETFGRVA